MPLSGVLAFQMDGVFIGATWSRDMRNMMLLSLAAYLGALVGLAPASAITGCGWRCTSSCGCAALSLLSRRGSCAGQAFS